MAFFWLTVDMESWGVYLSKAAAVRAGRRYAKSSFRVLEETQDGRVCVHAWDAPKEVRS